MDKKFDPEPTEKELYLFWKQFSRENPEAAQIIRYICINRFEKLERNGQNHGW